MIFTIIWILKLHTSIVSVDTGLFIPEKWKVIDSLFIKDFERILFTDFNEWS